LGSTTFVSGKTLAAGEWWAEPAASAQWPYFRPKHKKISSPSPREFGPKDAAIESSVDRIHEERGLGGEEQ